MLRIINMALYRKYKKEEEHMKEKIIEVLKLTGLTILMSAFMVFILWLIVVSGLFIYSFFA